MHLGSRNFDRSPVNEKENLHSDCIFQNKVCCGKVSSNKDIQFQFSTLTALKEVEDLRSQFITLSILEREAQNARKKQRHQKIEDSFVH